MARTTQGLTDAARFAREILDSEEYRVSLKNRALTGDLPPQVETTLMHYAWGKPPDVIELHETFDFSGFSDEDLAARAAAIVGRLERREESTASVSDRFDAVPDVKVH